MMSTADLCIQIKPTAREKEWHANEHQNAERCPAPTNDQSRNETNEWVDDHDHPSGTVMPRLWLIRTAIGGYWEDLNG